MAMRTRRAFLQELHSHLGEGERPPGSDDTIFNRFLGVGNGPWCMDFVSTCLWAAGIRDLAGVQGARGPSYVPLVFEWAEREGRIVPFEQALPGDAVVFGWPGEGFDPHGNHVGVLVSRDPFVTIEGDSHRSPNETGLNDRVLLRHDRSPSLALAFVRFSFGPDRADGDGAAERVPSWPGRILTLRTPLMAGADVRMWQQRLASAGWTIDVDGVYGPASADVCTRFQRRHELVADGQVGPTTWRASWTLADGAAPAAGLPEPEPREEEAAAPAARPVATGVDRADAPTLEEAEAIRAGCGARWWGAYVGGPCSAGSGWTPELVRALGAAGFEFLPIYVGQNDVPGSPARTFTRDQGLRDGDEAACLAGDFGWSAGRRVPVCLDVETVTYERQPVGTLAYVGGWVSAVRRAGFVPVVYGSSACLAALHGLPEDERPDGTWVASWRGQGRVDESLDPSEAPHLPPEAWQAGSRAWQYEGELLVPGARGPVDVSCSALALAPAPAA